jgi:hypothetical protein
MLRQFFRQGEKMKTHKLQIFLLALLLVGCGTTAAPTAVPVPTPTIAPTVTPVPTIPPDALALALDQSRTLFVNNVVLPPMKTLGTDKAEQDAMIASIKTEHKAAFASLTDTEKSNGVGEAWCVSVALHAKGATRYNFDYAYDLFVFKRLNAWSVRPFAGNEKAERCKF